jgi:putative acetyltransferase
MKASFKRTNAADPAFRLLILDLDRDLEQRYGQQQAFFDQFNSVEDIQNVIVAFDETQPVGCGAFKPYNADTVEIKRMFVAVAARGNKLGSKILAELEAWAKAEGFKRSLLETGKNQPEAIRLYNSAGYQPIPNYDQYAGVEMSLCMEKLLD